MVETGSNHNEGSDGLSLFSSACDDDFSRGTTSSSYFKCMHGNGEEEAAWWVNESNAGNELHQVENWRIVKDAWDQHRRWHSFEWGTGTVTSMGNLAGEGGQDHISLVVRCWWWWQGRERMRRMNSSFVHLLVCWNSRQSDTNWNGQSRICCLVLLRLLGALWQYGNWDIWLETTRMGDSSGCASVDH